ncbi:hypothetical protein DES39_0357 [Orbus hercynius]|uniref:Tail assembly protein n=1 Tax=Orbus hercynius TaxID=593135 RepID=A0A495RI08_9GAMM|nr:hypothetical protein [Orbus hercynius]RKS87142.1 hypothetical protein DES39_0357 [Orbus hercynius]
MEFLIMAAISMAISLVSSLLMPNKTQKPKPQTFNDESFPKVQDGATKVIVFGQVELSDWQVEWSGNFRTSAIKTKGGGKK